MSQPIRTYTEPVKLELGNMIIRQENGGWEIEVGGAEQPRWFATGESLEDVIGSLVRAVTEDAIADEARAWEENAGNPEDKTRMDFLDGIGAAWPEPKDGKRLLLVALPYKLLPGQIAPKTIREAIDYIIDCGPECIERALDGKPPELLNAPIREGGGGGGSENLPPAEEKYNGGGPPDAHPR